MSGGLDDLLKTVGDQLTEADVRSMMDECKFLKPMENFNDWNSDLLREYSLVRVQDGRAGVGFLRLLATNGFITNADVRVLQCLLQPLGHTDLLQIAEQYKQSVSTNGAESQTCNDVIDGDDHLHDVMLKVSDKLGRNWERLAYKGLRLPNAIIEDIRHIGRREGWGLDMLGLEAMQRWRSRSKRSPATLDNLKQALQLVELNLIVFEVFGE